MRFPFNPSEDPVLNELVKYADGDAALLELAMHNALVNKGDAGCVLITGIIAEIDKLNSKPAVITDKDRLDWLEGQSVTVKIPLVYGYLHCFYSCADHRDGDDTSDIREKIDEHLTKERKQNEPKKES